MPKSRRTPQIQHHKATGQARVCIDGQDHYLGAFGSHQAQERYDALITKWLSRDENTEQSRLTVGELVLLYLDHAQVNYRKGGKPTSEVHCIKLAARHLIKVHRTTRVRDFGPKAFKAVRQSMIEAGYVRTSINAHMGRIRRIFAWAVADELASPLILTALQAVQGLQAERTLAKESSPVMPVAQAAVDAIEPHVSRPIWGAIQVQLLAGMRPGEVLMMRGCDLNMSGAIWEYTPASHKAQHHGKKRLIFIGPKAQTVLKEFLRANLQEYLFRPDEGRAQWLDTCDGPGRRHKTGSQGRKPKTRYSVVSYQVAIRRGCERAFGMPAELLKIDRKLPEREQARLRAIASDWRANHCWHPHQLRHTAGTVVRRAASLEHARVVLGHSSAVTSEIYAEEDHDKAREIIGRVG